MQDKQEHHTQAIRQTESGCDERSVSGELVVEFGYDEQPFAANNRAEQWCRERGIAVGSMARTAPRGLKYGDYSIAKWHNLDGRDRQQLDGVMESPRFRYGPITVRLYADEQETDQ